MSTIQFSGLSSGMDTSSIVDALVQVDAKRLEPIAQKTDDLKSELTAVGRLQSYLSTFSESMSDLASTSSFYLSSLSSNDESIVTAKTTGDADLGQGSISIEVQSLAVNEKTQSNSYENTTEDRNLSGTFSINGKNVSVVESDSLAEIRDKINSTDGIGAVASIIKVNDGDYRLTITNDEGGTEGTVFGDGNGVLQSLGVLSGAQTIDSTSSGYDSEVSKLGISGTFTINGTDVTVTESDTLTDINDKLNAVSGVSSTVEKIDGKYQITNLTGATLDDDSENVLGRLGLTSSSKNVLQSGANAKLVLDGSIVIERNTNQIDDVIEGLELNLNKAEVGKQVTIDFSRDYSAVEDKVRSFVDSYNVVVNYISSQSKYDEETDTAGDLANSNLSRRVLSDLRGIINTDNSTFLPSDYATLSNIGITTDPTKGTLKVDYEKLNSAMETNFDAFVKMFTTTETTSVEGLNLGRTTADTKSGKYYADPVNHTLYDISEAKDAASSLPTSLDGSNTGEKYFLTSDLKMYTWDGSSWDGGTSIASAAVEFENGINTVTDGNGKGIGFDGSTAGVITFTKGYASLFEGLVDDTMLDTKNGYFKTEKDRINNTIKGYNDQYDRMEKRLTSMRERLVQQFAQVEQLISEMQSQSSGLTSLSS